MNPEGFEAAELTFRPDKARQGEFPGLAINVLVEVKQVRLEIFVFALRYAAKAGISKANQSSTQADSV